MTPIRRARRAGIIAALAALPLAAAYRFALVYRVRAGYPKQHPPAWEPDAVGLAFEALEIPTSDGLRIHAWYMPAGPDPAPGVVLVHGWESSRDRTLPHAQVLHAIGMHVLTIDVRGHGANPPEALPMSVGEYALDTRAAVAALRARPEVTTIGILGHSMGAAGSLVATAQDKDVDAVIAVAAPADPHRLTRQTFRLAKLPIPSVLAWPLAWLTTRVYLQPRGHTVASISATHAVRAIRVPVMLVHGTDDGVVPVAESVASMRVGMSGFGARSARIRSICRRVFRAAAAINSPTFSSVSCVLRSSTPLRFSRPSAIAWKIGGNCRAT